MRTYIAKMLAPLLLAAVAMTPITAAAAEISVTRTTVALTETIVVQSTTLDEAMQLKMRIHEDCRTTEAVMDNGAGFAPETAMVEQCFVPGLPFNFTMDGEKFSYNCTPTAAITNVTINGHQTCLGWYW